MRAAAVLTVGLAVLGAAGCGLGAGEAPQDVRLTVTRSFGAETLRRVEEARPRGSETVMRLLQRSADVKTRYGGGFVQEIDGVRGGREHGRPVDWFYFVNGVKAPKGAAATPVHPGDRIWWDHHDWGETMGVAAVVGSFPEPFVHGIDGKRLPVRLECAEPADRSCDLVADRLRAIGVRVARALLGSDSGGDTLRVVVGRWADVRTDRAVGGIARGPRHSGVFARFSDGGRHLALLDARGRTVERLAAGAGVVAATRYEEEAPTWALIGTDEAGVAAAARALDRRTLADRFAVAVHGRRVLALPRPGD